MFICTVVDTKLHERRRLMIRVPDLATDRAGVVPSSFHAALGVWWRRGRGSLWFLDPEASASGLKLEMMDSCIRSVDEWVGEHEGGGCGSGDNGDVGDRG